MATERHWCPKTVGDNTMRGHPCGRPARVERAGKWWCAQHDPEAVKARQVARDRAWDEQRAAARAEAERQFAHRAERERLADAAEGLLAALKELVRTYHEEATFPPHTTLTYRDCPSSDCQRARAAIAAAEGGTEEGA